MTRNEIIEIAQALADTLPTSDPQVYAANVRICALDPRLLKVRHFVQTLTYERIRPQYRLDLVTAYGPDHGLVGRVNEKTRAVYAETRRRMVAEYYDNEIDKDPS